MPGTSPFDKTRTWLEFFGIKKELKGIKPFFFKKSRRK